MAPLMHGGMHSGDSPGSGTSDEYANKHTFNHMNGCTDTHAFTPPVDFSTLHGITSANDDAGIPDPIAIIGMACRLPGDVSSDNELWELLRNGRSGQSEVPSSRFNIDAFYNAKKDAPDAIPMRGGYFINEDTRQFENSFFGINNLETMNMDPQQRKLLEVCFECLENAGISLDEVKGANVGCFVGNFTVDYPLIVSKDSGYTHRTTALGIGTALLSNRISYVFDLKGPSLTLDTACSSSLYCLHLAVNALRRKECDTSFVASANLIQSPEQQMGTARLGVLSPTSTCHPFAAQADGYGRAEGIGALYLKRLSDAIKDGDPIRSIIRGTAVNSNGKGNGITMPSTMSQREVIAKAYSDCGNVDFERTEYVECHGTGTQVGDPIEVDALTSFFRSRSTTSSKQMPPILIGSVKSNLGHSEATSGITSIMKATLVLENQWIPPTIGVEELNSNIPWAENGAEVVREGVAWPTSDNLRKIASVNSFGYGGANAHCVLERYVSSPCADPAYKDPDLKNAPMLLPLSAATEVSLLRRIEHMSDISSRSVEIDDLVNTLTNRRTHFNWRGFLIASSEQMSDPSRGAGSREAVTHAIDHQNKSIAFIFTGQGAQWPAMGRELYQRFPVFRHSIDNMDWVLNNLTEDLKCSLKGLIIDVERVDIHSPLNSQPACTAVQIALVDLLRDWNIQPKYVVGHSSGEIAAAYAAGYVTATNAILTAYTRGLAVSTQNQAGAMIAVGMSKEAAEAEIRSLKLTDHVCVACDNSPLNVTISGDEAAIDQLTSQLNAQSVFLRKVNTGGRAYHCHHMRAIGQAYEDLLGKWTGYDDDDSSITSPHSAIMISSVRARVVEQHEVARASYWRENLESPVLFRSAIELLATQDRCLMIEIGPHRALQPLVKQTLAELEQKEMPPYLSTLVRDRNGADCLMDLAGRLWCFKLTIDLNRVNHHESMTSTITGKFQRRQPKVLHDLPRYPWYYDDKPLWNESRASKEYRHRKYAHDELLGSLVPGLSGTTFTWRNLLRIDDVGWLKDHVISGQTVFPGAGYITMAVTALQQLEGIVREKRFTELGDLRILSALTIDKAVPVEIFTELSPRFLSAAERYTSSWSFVISTFTNGQSIRRATGYIQVDSSEKQNRTVTNPNDYRGEFQGVRDWYRRFGQAGLEYGQSFQSLKSVSTPRMRDTMMAKFTVSGSDASQDHDKDSDVRKVHPWIIDGYCQAALIASTRGDMESLEAQVPRSIDAIRIWPVSNGQNDLSLFSGFATARAVGAGMFSSDVSLTDGNGQLVMDICNLKTSVIDHRRTTQTDRIPMLRLEWFPDIKRVRPSQGSALLKAIQSGCSLFATSDFVGLTSSSRLVHLHGLLQCNTDVLHISSSDTYESAWRALGGGSTHPLFSTFTTARMNDDGTLEALQLTQMSDQDLLQSPQQKQPLTQRDFDLVLTDHSCEDYLERVLQEHVRPCGMMIHSGASPIDWVQHPSIDVVLVGGQENLAVLQRVQEAHHVPNENNDATQHERAVVLITRGDVCDFDNYLAEQLTRWTGTQPRVFSIDETNLEQILPGATIIVTAEIQDPLMTKISTEQMCAVQAITSRAGRLIWVVGGALYQCQSPDLATVFGFARAISQEKFTLDFQVVSLEALPDSLDASAENLRMLLETPAGSRDDHEFIEHEGLLYVSRCIPDRALNDAFNAQRHRGYVQMACQLAGPVRLDIDLPGNLDSLHYVPTTQHAPVQDEMLDIAVMAIGINAKVSVRGGSRHTKQDFMLTSYIKDVYTLHGRVQTQERTFALEYSGIVRRAGPNALNFRAGDRVVVAAPGPFSNNISVPERACAHMIEGESFTHLSAIPVVYMTALYALIDRARLQQSETVLIHSATGGVGMAAILVAKAIGATVFATVGSDTKREYLINAFGIRRDHIFNSRDTSFLSQLLAQTKGRGVDVVLNSLTGEKLHAGIKACANFGRFIEIGKSDIENLGNLPMSIFSRGLTFSAFDLSDLCYANTEAGRNKWHDLLARSIQMFRRCPTPMPRVFDAGDIQRAYRAFADPARMGKICVSFENHESLLPVKMRKHRYEFSASKSYLLVGCLGGLGRSLSRYMMQNGARHFTFIGRSGADKPAAASLVDDLRRFGASVTVIRGDVQDYSTVSRAVKALQLPLGGVVQAAMGLAEAMFDTMTLDKWQASMGPKVQGTWNLHRAIEECESSLDFFLMTSSLAGSVGAATEGNYCASNSFLDYFARYRRSMGRRAISVGLGTISEIGYLHEHPDIEKILDRRGLTATTEAEFLDICDIALCSQQTDDPQARQVRCSHILTGLESTNKRSTWEQGYEGAGQQEMMDPRLSILMHGEKDRLVEGAARGDNHGGRLPPTIAAAIQIGDLSSIAQAVFECIAAKISQLVLMPAEKVTPDLTLASIGMDSMLAAEYRSFMFHTLEVDVPFLTLMDAKATMSDISTLLAGRLAQ